MGTLSLKDKFSFGVILVELPFLIHNWQKSPSSASCANLAMH